MTVNAHPTTLYKYLAPERLADALPEQGASTLRLSPSSALNDPFEVMPGFDNYLSEEHLASAVSKMKADYPDDKDIESKCRKEVWHSRFRSEFTSRYREQFDRQLGIVSFSTNPANILMWAHYAASFRGFVVGYDFDAVAALVPEDLSGTLAVVEYRDERPRWANFAAFEDPQTIHENIERCYTTKSTLWSYEEEWRLILPAASEPEPPLRRVGGSITVVEFPRASIREILVSDSTSEELYSALAARGPLFPNAVMKRVYPAQDSFSCGVEALGSSS